MHYVISTVSTLGTIIQTMNGVVRVAEAAIDLKEALEDDSLESDTLSHKVRIGADIAIIAAQTLSVVGNHAHWSANTRLGLSLATGVADITQNINSIAYKKNLKVNDWINIGCSIALRVSAMANDTIELKPAMLGSHLEKVQYTASMIDLTCGTTRFAKDVVIPLIQYLRHRPDPVDMSIVLSEKDNKPAELKVDAQWAANIQQVLNTKTILEIDTIPELFKFDQILRQFKCSLTNKPIRHIVVVQGTEETPFPIYFEKKAIQEHLGNASLGRPAGWPSTVEFSHAHLKHPIAIQHQINNRLQALLDEMKGTPLYGLQDPIKQNSSLNELCRLAQRLGLHQEDKAEEQIADEIISKMHAKSAQLIANVTVYKIQSDLEKGVKEKNNIRISFVRTIIKKKTTLTQENLKDATFTLLGSQETKHHQILKLAVKTFSKVEISISTDLKYPNVVWS